jgi:glycosyltransferase involved in cell wall biosynthesis
MKSEPARNPQPRSSRVGLLTSWSSRLGGGVFEAVVSHARSLGAHTDFLPIVFAPADRFTHDDKKRFGDVELFTVPRVGPEIFGYAPGLLDRIIAADIDVLHLHGIWQYASLCGARWAERTKRPYVISPHGMLDPWITSRGRWKKVLARLGYEHRSWRDAALFHALTPAEADDITRNVETVAPAPRIEVVSNSVPPGPEPKSRASSRRLLYIGRIHPKKNLANLIDSWTAVQGSNSGYRLSISGWGENDDLASLKLKLTQLSDPSIEFLGPVYGEAKLSLLEQARFLVLPSLSEGLPMAVLEAWAAGTPCLMSAACNLPEGIECGAAIETGTNVSSISNALRAAIALPDSQWTAMSIEAYRLALERFSPQVIASRWNAIYHTLL